MSRINTNINSMIAQRILGQQNSSLSKSLERLSTGLAINRGADNPAGLIASEKLRSEKTAISAAMTNAERAEQISNIAEGGLQEIQSQLTQLQSLVGETANKAGLSDAEKEANQQQVDAILQTIDRIASTTSFAGTKLLNGTYDFTISNKAATVADYQINAAKIPFNGSVAVKALVTTSARRAGAFLSAAATLDLNTGSSLVFDLQGVKGSRQFSFASGTSLTDIATTINAFKSVTGVSALVSGAGVVFKSEDFGSDQFVGLKFTNAGGATAAVYTLSATSENARSGTSTTVATGAFIRNLGQDIGATINGVAARGKGKIASINTDSLDVSLELTTSGAQTIGNINAFTITGGGAKFHLGPTIDINNQVSLGIRNVATRNLGTTTLGYLSDIASGKTYNIITGNSERSQQIVDKAIEQVSQLRGRLGSFQSNVVASTINALGVALENTSAAESVIRDTNFAKETATMTRNQILVQAATSVLATANNQPQTILSLLRG